MLWECARRDRSSSSCRSTRVLGMTSAALGVVGVVGGPTTKRMHDGREGLEQGVRFLLVAGPPNSFWFITAG